MCEVWVVSDIVSIIIIAIDLYCIPKHTGLEGTCFKKLLKVAFGWKITDMENQRTIRTAIAKFVFIPRIGVGLLLFIIEFGLLLREEIDTLDPSFIYVIICLVLFLVFLVVMIYCAYCTELFEGVIFHQVSVQMFHRMDAIINSALFALAKKLIYDDLKPAPSITYFIYIFSIVDCAWCVFQALKSYLIYLYLFCRKD